MSFKDFQVKGVAFYILVMSSVVLQLKLPQKTLDEMFIEGHDKGTF